MLGGDLNPGEPLEEQSGSRLCVYACVHLCVCAHVFLEVGGALLKDVLKQIW